MLKARMIFKRVIIVAFMLLICGCATTKKHWEHTIIANNIEAYEDFLRNHVTSEYSDEAKKRLEFLYSERDWKSAHDNDDIDSYEDFLRRHHTSEYSDEAKKRLEFLYPEKDWKSARDNDDIDSYEDFLRRHHTSEYSDKAKKRLEDLYSEKDWKSARDNDNIDSYEDFLRRHNKSSFVGEATSRIVLLKRYIEGWQKVQKTPTLKAYRNYISQNPQSPYVASAKEAILDMEGRDIVDLFNEKKIEVETTGSGIQSVNLKVRRMVPYPLTLRVPVGTYFVSRNSSSQNMITTVSYEQTLKNGNWISLSISAACANRSRNIPGNSDSFTIQRSPQQSELTKLMPILDKAGVPYPVRQAAVWIVTDNADYDDLGILVSRSIFQPFGGTRQIEESETVQAMRFCSEAGVNLRQKAIWNDRETLYWGLDDNANKLWLGNQDKTITQKVEQQVQQMDQKLASVDPSITKIISSKRLSFYIGVASNSSKKSEGIWTTQYLRRLGHKVEAGRVSTNTRGITIHYREGLQNEAKAISDLFAVLFRSTPEMKKIGDEITISNEDIVIWFR